MCDAIPRARMPRQMAAAAWRDPQRGGVGDVPSSLMGVCSAAHSHGHALPCNMHLSSHGLSHKDSGETGQQVLTVSFLLLGFQQAYVALVTSLRSYRPLRCPVVVVVVVVQPAATTPQLPTHTGNTSCCIDPTIHTDPQISQIVYVCHLAATMADRPV